MRKIIVVDICDTLFPENTTVGFIEYFLRNKAINKIKLHRIYLLKVVNSLIYKVLSFDIIRLYLIGSLRGYEKNQLEVLAQSYIDTLPVNKKVLDLVDGYRDAGYEIQFHSASLSVVVECVSNTYGATSFSCSELMFIDGKCNGRLLTDNLGKKDQHFKLIREKFDEVVFVTDNLSDVNCIEYCDEFVAVIPKGKAKHNNFWSRQQNVKIMEL